MDQKKAQAGLDRALERTQVSDMDREKVQAYLVLVPETVQVYWVLIQETLQAYWEQVPERVQVYWFQAPENPQVYWGLVQRRVQTVRDLPEEPY